MFLLRKWVEKTVKSALIAFLAAPLVTEWMLTLGVTVDQDKLYAGSIVAVVSGLNWLKHQAWTPKLLRLLL